MPKIGESASGSADRGLRAGQGWELWLGRPGSCFPFGLELSVIRAVTLISAISMMHNEHGSLVIAVPRLSCQLCLYLAIGLHYTATNTCDPGRHFNNVL